jgi:Tfp pilus assembly protein PilF/V8-like Glu-specific endopeptidase
MNGIVPILLGLSLGVQAIPALAANPSQQVKAVTVSIETPTSNGSGVIVSQQPGKYFVLTAAHVVRNSQSYTIRTSDGQKYRLDKTNLFPQGVDLAVVSFSSSKNYPVATIGNSDDAEEGSTAAVSGYPRSDKQLPVYSFRSGRVVANSSQGLADGYGLVYSSSTLPGMSGGGVFNDKGELIAIHGKGDITAPTSSANGSGVRLKTGYDLGIPINTFIKLAKDLNGLPKFTQKTAQNPNRPRSGSALLSGLDAMRKKDFAQAIGFFDRAVQLDPKDSTAYYYRGLCQKTLGNEDAALEDITRSIQANGNSVFPYIFRAAIYFNRQDTDKAEADLNKAIQVDPNNSYAYTFHSMVYAQKKNLPKAFADLDRAIKLDPNNGSAYNLRAMLYLATKNRAKSLADLEQAARAYKASGEIENYQSTQNTLELLRKYPSQ